MITISPSTTADTRSCDPTTVTKQQLYDSSVQHIGDVRKALAYFSQRLNLAGLVHDYDKLTDIKSFHRDFVGGFVSTAWWDRHRQLNRHHLTVAQDGTLPDSVPADVNLIDVLDCIADCVMAGLGRSGSVWPITLPPGLLETAFQNTIALLQNQVVVVPSAPSEAEAHGS